MNDNNTPPNQSFDPVPIQTTSQDLNNVLAQIPTPVSNNIRASETNAFMSPLEVGQQGYDRMNGVQYSHPPQGNEDVYLLAKKSLIKNRCILLRFCLRL